MDRCAIRTTERCPVALHELNRRLQGAAGAPLRVLEVRDDEVRIQATSEALSGLARLGEERIGELMEVEIDGLCAQGGNAAALVPVMVVLAAALAGALIWAVNVLTQTGSTGF